MSDREFVTYKGNKYYVENFSLSLERLEIEDINEIIGLDTLTNLKILNLRGNSISKIENLEKLVNLKILNLSINSISIIENLDKLVNLKTLILSINYISKIKNLEKLIKLTGLNLAYNYISKIENLGKLVNLIELDLFDNSISKVENLDTLVNLIRLDLGRNSISIIENMDKLVNLIWLNLGVNFISIIENLDTLVNLIGLNLQDNAISKIENLDILVNLTILVLDDNSISKIENLDWLVNLEYLYLGENMIENAEELIKIIEFYPEINVRIDYKNLKNVTPEIEGKIVQFLQLSFTKNEKEFLYSYIKSDKIQYLDNQIAIANILVNLYHESIDRDDSFQTLCSLIDTRTEFEEDNSKNYYKFIALKNIFMAGMEDTYQEQLHYLEEAKRNFALANEISCENVYGINILFIKSLRAWNEKDIETCRLYNKEIDSHIQSCKDLQLNSVIGETLKNYKRIIKKMVDYTVEPEHLERLKEEISNTCDVVLNDAFPQLQYSRPGFYRIIENIIKNTRETWHRENWEVKRSIRSQYPSCNPESDISERIKRVSNNLGKKEDKIQEWLNNFLENEQEFALRLLEHFRYVDLNKLEEICRDNYLFLMEQPNVSKENVRFITFGPESKSNKMIAYHFALKARKLGIPTEMFLDVYNRNFKFPTGKIIVYLDDVIGSGNQFIDNWRKFKKYMKETHEQELLKFINENQLYCLPLFTTVDGKKKIDENSEFEVISRKENILTEKDMALTREADIFDKTELPKAKKIFREYGKKLYKKAPLGYGDCGLLLAFFYNTPNNTLPVIWQSSEKCGWTQDFVPIFPRFEREKMEDF